MNGISAWVAAFSLGVAVVSPSGCVQKPRSSGQAKDAAPARQDSSETCWLDRGARLRTALLNSMELSYEQSGNWPDQITDGDPTWVYTKPKLPPASDSVANTLISEATIVVRESQVAHPDGIWVGYADGHIEYVSDNQALVECAAQLPLAENAVEAYRSRPENPGHTPLPAVRGSLRLRALDPEGRPVSGAVAGTFGSVGDRYATRFKAFFGFRMLSSNKKGSPEFVTDVNGLTTIPAMYMLQPRSKFGDQQTEPLWIVDHDRGLIACLDVKRSDFASEAGGAVTHTVQLQALCQLNGRVTSVGLKQIGREVQETQTILARPGYGAWYTVQGWQSGDQFHFDVPPGDWGIIVRSGETRPVGRFFHVSPGTRSMNLLLDLPPDEMLTRFGQPAPELAKIKAWKNGGPTTLADLRGKVVLLDFWGYWCGPCVGSMPYLMKLHDEFKGNGLVILAVHDDSADTMEQVTQRCLHARETMWGGRDLPFLVALDGGGSTRIRHTATYVRGATTAAYGIQGFPTTFLIDRSGKLVGEVDAGDPKLHDTIERLLSGPASATQPN